jgi:hypothetical protein
MPDFDLGLGRHVGLTHVIDKGLGPRAWEDILEVAGEHISIVKLGWGTAYVTGNLERKLDVLGDKPVVIGGTFFEACYAKEKLDEYKQWLQRLGLTHVEISDGTIAMPRERKLELIADFARDFTVLSEVGSKDSSVEYSVAEWTTWLNEELAAGAWKVITEAREGGTAGIFDSSGGHADGADRRDRKRRRPREHRLRGADQGSPGMVREAVRPVGQPRQHPARGSDRARDAPPRPARRHAEGGAPWRPASSCRTTLSR